MVTYSGRYADYTLDRLIGSGGEGSVFSVTGSDDIVAKIYNDNVDLPERESKVMKMLSMALPQELSEMVTWPMDALYEGGRFKGFVMRRMKIRYMLTEITDYPYSDDHPQRMGYETYWIIAWNLAHVFSELHDLGIVVGDVNENNIGFGDDGTPKMLDCDSFHLSDEHRCVVARPEYIPFFLNGALSVGFDKYPGPTFRVSSDCWALAVHIFSLLCNGSHPFACASEAGSVRIPNIPENIKNRASPFFVGMGGLRPPLYAPSLGILPDRIREMFRRAFVGNESDIPSASEWTSAIEEVLSKGFSSICKKKHHVLPEEFVSSGVKECPLCKARETAEGNRTPDSEYQKYLIGGNRIITHIHIPPTPFSNPPVVNKPAKVRKKRFNNIGGKIRKAIKKAFKWGWISTVSVNTLFLVISIISCLLSTSNYAMMNQYLVISRALLFTISLIAVKSGRPGYGIASAIAMIGLGWFSPSALFLSGFEKTMHWIMLGISGLSFLEAKRP